MNAPWLVDACTFLRESLTSHLALPAWKFLEDAKGVRPADLGPVLARASRFARSRPLGLSPEACCKAAGIRAGWNPFRLQVLEALRLLLLLDREDLASVEFERGYLGLFPYADEGEARALYKALALLPGGERFAMQAAEGCRTNVTGIFEAVACDSPYPAAFLPTVAWQALCIKALFVGVPLWRVHGLDGRLSAELARIALDLCEERRSAGRPIPVSLWLLLGTHGGPRGLASLQLEWETTPPGKRGPLISAFARAGALREIEGRMLEPFERLTLSNALEGRTDSLAWRAFEA